MQFLKAFKKVAISLCNTFKYSTSVYILCKYGEHWKLMFHYIRNNRNTEKWCFITLETTPTNSLLTFTSNTWVFILCSRVIILPLISTGMTPVQPRRTQQHNSIFKGHKCEKHIHCLHSFEFVHIQLDWPMQWLEAPGINVDMQLGCMQYLNPSYEKCDLPMGSEAVLAQLEWKQRCPLSPACFSFCINENHIA